jgi:16S rRNA (guanine966-N2)-methyltransferase
MRVIAGTARGIRLQAPRGLAVRPTSDRVRESLFNILQPRLGRARFLDLFAGTGANGIEALSRGAAAAAFVESDRDAVESIRANLAKAGFVAKALVVRGELPGAAARGVVPTGPWDIVFADPPYVWNQWTELAEYLTRRGLVAPDGLVIAEHADDNDPGEIFGELPRYRSAKYGRTALSFYARHEP